MRQQHVGSACGLTGIVILVIALAGGGRHAVSAADSGWPQEIHAILQAHCLSCHGAEKPKAGLDLTRFQTPADFRSRHDI